MNVEVHLIHQTVACSYHDVRNAFTKDGMYCIFTKEGTLYEHPVGHIFRVKIEGGPQFKPPANIQRKIRKINARNKR